MLVTNRPRLTPSQTAVLELCRLGACPRDFANHDIYRYSARIHELRKLGYVITSYRCPKHPHQRYIQQYVLLRYEKPWGER